MKPENSWKELGSNLASENQKLEVIIQQTNWKKIYLANFLNFLLNARECER